MRREVGINVEATNDFSPRDFFSCFVCLAQSLTLSKERWERTCFCFESRRRKRKVQGEKRGGGLEKENRNPGGPGTSCTIGQNATAVFYLYPFVIVLVVPSIIPLMEETHKRVKTPVQSHTTCFSHEPRTLYILCFCSLNIASLVNGISISTTSP